ncbi:hypothetical protein MKW98_013609 [Papaver atlanticum]|uniref:Methyltransferase type 11 domain-containing protein n=1 Tax=Papaver atlanticum TaxID=357466 RepID=A0AAD4RZC4_9MAGN|nr:hypothetical protein MKW98_013609 [Papaver atlanticum]
MDPEPTSTTNRSVKSSVGPSNVTAYLDPLYWDKRFSSEEHYEWLKEYSHFRHLIQLYIKPISPTSVLELGCGNSQLGEELHKDGITGLTCIDLSAVAVDNMQKRLLSKGIKVMSLNILLKFKFYGAPMFYISYDYIQVLVADMLDLPFDKESFDVVIEKGTMDVVFVDSGDPWNPRPETVKKAMTMLQGVHRVLKPDGVFVSISFGQPHFRRPLFEAPEFSWSIEWKTFGDGFHYFFYILKKGRRMTDSKPCMEKSDRPSISLYQEELEDENYMFRTNVEEL